jgi:hypothetical protein
MDKRVQNLNRHKPIKVAEFQSKNQQNEKIMLNDVKIMLSSICKWI